jgi:uncharacterized protein (TIGR02444 family)
MTESDSTPATGSPFWRFSLGFYRQPGVADACLVLQDRFGADVNTVLFLLWLATDKRQLRQETVQSLADKVRAWQSDVVLPLRELRRRLKSASPLVEASTAEVFRNKIKATELEAERLQQEAMFALSKTLASVPAESVTLAARANIKAYETVTSQRFDSAVIDVLVTALEQSPAGQTR